MPVHRGEDKDDPSQLGESGNKYRYESGDDESREAGAADQGFRVTGPRFHAPAGSASMPGMADRRACTGRTCPLSGSGRA